jgi:hypothetical protein
MKRRSARIFACLCFVPISDTNVSCSFGTPSALIQLRASASIIVVTSVAGVLYLPTGQRKSGVITRRDNFEDACQFLAVKIEPFLSSTERAEKGATTQFNL